MKDSILKYISENPGKNKTQIFQGTSAIPVKCNHYLLEMVINGLIEIEGKNGTYSITEKGNEYLDSICPKVVTESPKTESSDRFKIMKEKLRNLSIKIK